MPRKGYSTEQIINTIRQAEAWISQGQTIGEVAKELAISERTFYRRGRRQEFLLSWGARQFREMIHAACFRSQKSS